jgi:hypothetical protein
MKNVNYIKYWLGYGMSGTLIHYQCQFQQFNHCIKELSDSLTVSIRPMNGLRKCGIYTQWKFI